MRWNLVENAPNLVENALNERQKKELEKSLHAHFGRVTPSFAGNKKTHIFASPTIGSL